MAIYYVFQTDFLLIYNKNYPPRIQKTTLLLQGKITKITSKNE